MSQQTHGTSLFSPADTAIKRKRGRPRKDDNQLLGENSPAMHGSDSLKKNKEIMGATNATVDDMVGKVVSGVIEGSFDAGYFLNVNVEDTDTQLRGVVFLPGRFTPITAANDVAPNAKMYSRQEIPIPVQDPKTVHHDLVPPLEHIINKKATESKMDAPKFADQVPPPEVQSGVPTADESQSDSVMEHLADKLPMNETGPYLGEKFTLQQTVDPGVENQTALIMAQLKHEKVVEQDQVQHDTVMDAKASKELEPASVPPEPVPTPIVDLIPSSENANQEPQVGYPPLCSDPEPSDCVPEKVKSENIEDHQTAVLTKPESMSSKPVGVGLLMDTPNLGQNPNSAEPKSICTELLGTDIIKAKDNSPRKYVPEDALLELANKTIAEDEASFPVVKAADTTSGGYDQSLPFGGAVNIIARGSDTSLSVGDAANNTFGGYSTPQPVNKAANISVGSSNATPMTNLSVMTFGGEAISTEPNLGTEEPVLLEKPDAQICSTSAATKDVDPDLKAAMTHTHLDLSSGLNLSGSS